MCNKTSDVTFFHQTFLLHFYSFLLFFVRLCPGVLTSAMFIFTYTLYSFYKPTVLKVHPPNIGITAHSTMPGWLKHSSSLFCSILLNPPMNGAWKILSSWGFEPLTSQSWVCCLNHYTKAICLHLITLL